MILFKLQEMYSLSFQILQAQSINYCCYTRLFYIFYGKVLLCTNIKHHFLISRYKYSDKKHSSMNSTDNLILLIINTMYLYVEHFYVYRLYDAYILSQSFVLL